MRRRIRGGVVLMSGSGNALSGVVLTFYCVSNRTREL